jgi:Glycosyl transferase family 11
VIVVRLTGGLGNQMFQYATGLSLALRHGVELVLDTSWTLEMGRAYELDCFQPDARLCPVGKVGRVPNTSRMVRVLQRLRPSRRPWLHVITENHHTNEFDAAVLHAPDDTYLCGYWQFEEYFSAHESEVRQSLRFPALTGDAERIAQEVQRTQAVSVHVRRGDYLKHEHLRILDVGYYTRATQKVIEVVGDARIFVFSDEPQWCAENLEFKSPTTVVDRSFDPQRDWEDMCLMSLCDHHVIANSTYSWWGAWLNPSPEKIVVAPARWVGSDHRAGDPVPRRWVRI